MRALLTTIVFLLPFRRVKVGLLNRLGHDIHPTAYLGINLVRGVRRFELAEGSGIGNFNMITGLQLVKLGYGSRIHYFNFICSGYTPGQGDAGGGAEGVEGLRGTLQMGEQSRIISLHFADCSGGVVMGDDTWLTGVRSTLLSHAFDPTEGTMILEPIVLEKGAVIATSCTLLPGAVVGEGALMAAGSTAWTRQKLAAQSLHGGVPSRRLSPIEIHPWVYRFQRYLG